MKDAKYSDLKKWTRKAVDNYDNRDVSESYSSGTPLDDCGDTLFTFIVREMEDAGNEDEASKMMETAIKQFEHLASKISEMEATVKKIENITSKWHKTNII